jgi:hypothetical protein
MRTVFRSRRVMTIGGSLTGRQSAEATLVDLTLVLWTPGPIRSHREEFLPESLWAPFVYCIQTQSFLLGDNSSIITLYLNPFITSSYYKNTIR